MNTGESLLCGVMLAGWVLGIAVAKGFWITLGCVFLPPLAWVVFAQWGLGA